MKVQALEELGALKAEHEYTVEVLANRDDELTKAVEVCEQLEEDLTAVRARAEMLGTQLTDCEQVSCKDFCTFLSSCCKLSLPFTLCLVQICSLHCRCWGQPRPN